MTFLIFELIQNLSIFILVAILERYFNVTVLLAEPRELISMLIFCGFVAERDRNF